MDIVMVSFNSFIVTGRMAELSGGAMGARSSLEKMGRLVDRVCLRDSEILILLGAADQSLVLDCCRL